MPPHDATVSVADQGDHAPVPDDSVSFGRDFARKLTGDHSLRSVLDSISEGFALLDADFRIVEINAEAVRLNTMTREQLVGKTHWDAYPGSEDSPLGILYKTAMRERRTVTLEHHYVWEDGRSAWFDMRAYPVTGAGLAIFFRDVTEQHESEQRRRQSEDRFRAAIDATQGILWTNDAEGRMVGEQAGWAALTGQSFDDYQGYGWASAVHPDDAQPTINAWELAVAARAPFVFEHRVRRHDGAWRRFAIRAIPVLTDDGHIREWVGVHHDITATVTTQEQLARSAKIFAALVRNTPFGIYVVDSDFQLRDYSKGAAKVFANIDPLVGRDFAEIMRLIWQEPLASEFISRFRTTLETGESYCNPRTIGPRANIDGTEAYDWQIDRIVLPDGTNGVACYFYDLSEQTRLAEDLRQALADKDLLASEIEHRVKNSLTIVSSLLLLQQSAAGSVETRDALAAAASRVMAIGRVHEQLYKGQHVGTLEFGSYLRQLCADIERTLGRANVTFDVHADIVPLSVDAAVPLGIVTNELITNACKYCAGGTDARIMIRLSSASDALILRVSDNGPGVPADFSPLSGRGLGLRAIDALVRQIDGTIVFPTAGSEARFEVTVPIGASRLGSQ